MADIKNDFATGLKAHWRLEEASGARVDSVGANDLTDNNTVGQGTGIQGNCADFEDTNLEYLSASDHADISVDDGWSVSMWMNFESLSTPGVGWSYYGIGQRLSENGWGIGMITVGASDYRFSVWTGAGSFGNSSTTASVAVDTWYHVVVYFNGSSTKIYINGASPETLSRTAITPPAIDLILAKNPSGSNQYFDGLIDEVTMWDREITASDVATLYNSGNGIPYEDTGVTQGIASTAQATAGIAIGHFADMDTTAQATASVLKEMSVAIATTASATVKILRSITHSIIANAQATAVLLKTQVTPVVMAVTASATAGLTKIAVNAVNLAVTAQATVTLSRVRNFVRTIASTAQATPAVVKSGIIILRTLATNARATISVGKSLVLSKALTATAKAVTSLLTDWGYIDKYPENDTTYQDKYPE